MKKSTRHETGGLLRVFSGGSFNKPIQNIVYTAFLIFSLAVLSSSRCFALDTPVQSNWSPAPGVTITTDSPTITFTTDENAWCRWYTDDLDYASMFNDCGGTGTTSQSCAVTGLYDGSAWVYISCRDTALNADTVLSNTNINYTVNTSPPSQMNWSPAKQSMIGTTSPTITFTTNEIAYCKWSLSDLAYGAMGGDCTGDGTTSQSCATSGLSAPSDDVYTACADTNGNANTALNNEKITYDIDTTPPTNVGYVYDGLGADIDVSTSSTTLSANWGAASDPETGLKNYVYAIGTTSGGSDTYSWATTSSGVLSMTVPGLTLASSQTYYFSVKARNMVNNDSGVITSDGVFVKFSPPDQSNWSPAKGTSIYTSALAVTFDTNENAYCRWSTSDDGYAQIGSSSDSSGGGSKNHSCSVFGLSDGAVNIYIACSDMLGNRDTTATNEHVNYVVDTTPPSQSAWSPAKGSIITTTSPTITFTLNENGDCKWSLTDLTYDAMTNDCTGDGTMSMSCATSGLAQGAEMVYVSCKDTPGNKDDSSTNEHINYTVDSLPPTQSAWSPAKSANILTTSPTITFTLNETGDCKWSLNDDTYDAMTNDCTGDGTTSMSCATSGLSQGAEIVYTACMDSAGNKDDAAANEHINYSVDSLPPTQSAWNPAGGSTLTSTSQAISLTLNESGDCKWALTDQTYAAMTNACANTDTTHKICSATGLIEGAEMVYISCRDTAGNADNATTNTDLSYTVDTLPPTQGAWAPAKSAAITTTSPTITFTLNETGDCKWSLTDDTYDAMTNDCTGDGTTSMSCATTGLSQGAEIVYTACKDSAGNKDDAAANEHINYTVDTLPPTQSAWNPAGGSTLTSTSQAITLTLNESGDCRWALTDLTYAAMSNTCANTDATHKSCSVTGLAQGADTVSIACQDIAGNADNATTNTDLNYTVDSLPPTQSAWAPAKGTALTTISPTITFTLNETGDCKWSLTDDTYDAMTNDCTGDGTTSMSCATSGLSQGAEIVYAACKDTAGNKDDAAANEHINYTVDSLPPTQSAWAPAKGATITTTSSTITFTLNENGDCRWALTDDTYDAMAGDCTGDGTTSMSCVTSGLSQGAEIVYTACKDAAGNKDDAAANEHIDYTVDTLPPTQSAWNPANSASITTSAPTITFTLNETGDCRWALTDQTYAAMGGDCTGDGTMSMSCATSGLAEGANSVHIACRDSALNADNSTTNTDLSYTVDSARPTRSSVSPANASSLTTNSPIVTFTTNESAYCKWDLADLDYDSMSGDCAGDGTTSQSCAVSGLPQGAASVHLACSDIAGNKDTIATNEDLSYTVDSLPPAPSGFIPAGGSTLTAATATVNFTTNENADCKWALSDLGYDAMSGDCTGDGTTILACAVTALSEGVNTLSISCRDTVGNKDTASTNEDLIYTVDTTPPAPFSFSPANGASVNTATPTITFNTDETADCRWALTDLGYDAMAGDCSGDGSTSQSCASSGLLNGTNTVHISCADAHGNKDTAGTNEDLTYTMDIARPLKSNFFPPSDVSLGGPSAASPTVTFDTDEPAWCGWAFNARAYDDMAPGGCSGGGTASQTCQLSSLLEGDNYIYFACTDAAGNEDTIGTNDSVHYFVDSIPPHKSGFNPADSSTVRPAIVPITFGTDEQAACQWDFNDVGYNIAMPDNCSTADSFQHECDVNFDSLPEGTQTVHISCAGFLPSAPGIPFDMDTPSTNSDLAYIIDGSAPIQSGWSPASGAVTGATITITFNTNENATCKWSLSDVAYSAGGATCSGAASKNQSCAVTPFTSDGPVSIYLACADSFGNENSASNNTRLGYTVNFLPPLKSNFVFNPASGSSPANSTTLTFTTDESASCKWALTDLSYDSMSGDCAGDGTTSQSCPVTGLAPGANTVYIACSGNNNNKDTASSNEHLSYAVSTARTGITISRGWNLAGISKQTMSFNPTTVFTTSAHEIVSYNGTAFVFNTNETLFSPTFAAGYWIYSDNNLGTITAGGTAFTGGSYSITLHAGWNIISNPFTQDIDWNSPHAFMTCNSTPAALPTLYSSSDGKTYFPISPNAGAKILPWYGYMINLSTSCTLTITK